VTAVPSNNDFLVVREPPKYGGNAKAMMVCIDKITCAKMVMRIKLKWKEKTEVLKAALFIEQAKFDAKRQPYTEGLRRDAAKIDWMLSA